MPKLKKKYPDLAKEFHPCLNGDVKPADIDTSSEKRWWWKCPNKKCKKDYRATILQRVTEKVVCPKCSVRKEKIKVAILKKDDWFIKWGAIKKDVLASGQLLEDFFNDDISIKRRLKSGNKAWKYMCNLDKFLSDFRLETISYLKSEDFSEADVSETTGKIVMSFEDWILECEKIKPDGALLIPEWFRRMWGDGYTPKQAIEDLKRVL